MGLGYIELMILAITFFSLLISFFKTSSGLPWNWPFIGMSPMIFLNRDRLGEKLAELLQRSNGTFFITGPWFTKLDMVVTSDPANLYYITTKNFFNYPKGLESKELFDFLGNSLFTIDFEEWTRLRKLTHSFFKHQKFRNYSDKVIFDEVNNGLIPILEQVAKQGLVVDFQDFLKRYAFDIACMMSTGLNPNALSIDFPQVPFIKAVDDACEAVYYRHISPESLWKLKRWLQLGTEKKLSNARKALIEVMGHYTSIRTEQLKIIREKKEDDDCFDVLRIFLITGNDNEIDQTEYFEDEIVRDNVVAFTFAASDTAAPVLSWFFWLLSKNPHVEDKIREELDKKYTKKDCKEELKTLVYLHAALCESIRLYPPAPFQHRNAVKSDILPSGHHVKSNVRVMLSAYATGRMSFVWGDDCLEFKPERWLDKEGKIKFETPSKFFTFNAGPRICVGKELAFKMMKAAVATVVQNYHVEVVETKEVIPKPSIILHMKHGLRVRLKKRYSRVSADFV